MPLVPSNYSPPIFYRSGHLATIYCGLFRRVKGLTQTRERLTLSDGDFLDLDWSRTNAKTSKLVVLLHGLEGDAQRPYITGSAKLFNQNGFDACAVNYRGCSGEPNMQYRSYHSGATEDLIEVINHILSTKAYTEIYLKGFSLGGNLALKYLGEDNSQPPEIKAAVAVSVPCSLLDTCNQLLSNNNILYEQRFRKHLIAKLKQKQPKFPHLITDTDIKSIKTLRDFDNIFTSKAHNFKDAFDYYDKCSSLQFLPNITIPSLIINAQNDSFLGKDCYPISEAKQNESLFLETPKYGGHVGFWGKQNITYSERKSLEFFKKY